MHHTNNGMLWVVALPHRMSIVAIALSGILVCNGANDDEFKTVDVAKLANITHGTGNYINFICYAIRRLIS